MKYRRERPLTVEDLPTLIGEYEDGEYIDHRPTDLIMLAKLLVDLISGAVQSSEETRERIAEIKRVEWLEK